MSGICKLIIVLLCTSGLGPVHKADLHKIHNQKIYKTVEAVTGQNPTAIILTAPMSKDGDGNIEFNWVFVESSGYLLRKIKGKTLCYEEVRGEDQQKKLQQMPDHLQKVFKIMDGISKDVNHYINVEPYYIVVSSSKGVPISKWNEIEKVIIEYYRTLNIELTVQIVNKNFSPTTQLANE